MSWITPSVIASIKLNYPFLRPLPWFAPWGYFLAAVLALVVAVGILLAYFQKTKKDLKDSEERFRRLAENAPDIIYRYSFHPAPVFDYVSPTATGITGFTPEEYYVDPDLRWKIIHPDDRHILQNPVQFHASFGKPLVLRWVRKDGTPIWVEQHNVPLYDETGSLKAVEGIVRDITGRKKMEERLQYLAMHDPLTNLPNRHFLEETLKRAAAKAKRGEKSALLFIDLDNFKLVNDTLGHAAGDELLIAISGILKGKLREGDYLARLGGDEFALLLEGTTVEEAGNTAENLRRAVDESEMALDPLGPGINLSISVGMVMVDGTLDSQKLLSLADTALYSAKEGGRNTVAFANPGEDVSARLTEVSRLLALIKSALKENLFVLFFQPVFDVRNERIIHHEVLIRLQEKTGEILYPGSFIPIAERFGLMSQIDRWVVKSSLNNLRQYPSLNLFVNLSGASLGDEALLEFVEENIRESSVAPSRLGFEITETAAVKDLARAERWIRKLKKIGCRFALDDFGIGFSSFSYLRDLPVDYLKIDGSYVRNLDVDSTHLALVQAMNAVANTLGKKTVAEFVENENILKILLDLKIDCGQGYYLGKPSVLPEGVLRVSDPRRVSA